MSFTSEQKIGKYTYVYEAESYWDKEKKQPRQRRVYLGKRDPKTGEIVPTQKTKTVRSVKDYGNVYFLDKLSEQVGLKECLKETYPDLWQEIITCAFFEISEAKPLYLCNPWLELTYNEQLCSSLTSQRISELLRDIGEASRDRIDFFRLWVNMQRETNCIFYDITSLSSYSKTIDLVEWGYNRDKEKLPQINLGVIYGEPLSLPLFYSIYPGSIPDVSTLRNTLTLTAHMGLKGVTFIMDKGFYSKHNLNEIKKAKMRLIIPYPETNKAALELIRKHSDDISSPLNTFRVNKDILFGTKDKVSIGGATYDAFIYLDEKKKLDESDHFFRRLIDIEEKLKELDYETKEDIENYLADNLKGWRNYIRISKKAEQFIIGRRANEINKTLERMGKFILLSNYRIAKEDVILLYRKKDAIEKYFDNMKNDLDVKRLGVHTTAAMEGRLFTCFISLILHSWLSRKMREQNLYKDYTVQEIIYELKKIKRIQLDERRTIITEISKKQRELFKYFNIDLPAT